MNCAVGIREESLSLPVTASIPTGEQPTTIGRILGDIDDDTIALVMTPTIPTV